MIDDYCESDRKQREQYGILMKSNGRNGLTDIEPKGLVADIQSEFVKDKVHEYNLFRSGLWLLDCGDFISPS